MRVIPGGKPLEGDPPSTLVYGFLLAFGLHLLNVFSRNIMRNLEMPRFNPRGKNILRPLGGKIEVKALHPLNNMPFEGRINQFNSLPLDFVQVLLFNSTVH